MTLSAEYHADHRFRHAAARYFHELAVLLVDPFKLADHPMKISVLLEPVAPIAVAFGVPVSP